MEEEYTKKEYIDQFIVYQTKIVDGKYRVVNYVKSMILMMMTPISLYTLYKFYINDPQARIFELDRRNLCEHRFIRVSI